MTSLIEKLVAIIAPHHCRGCGIEDNILCEACMANTAQTLSPICCMCGVSSPHWQLCKAHHAAVSHMWAASEYGGAVEKLIRTYKFERARAAYYPLTTLIEQVLPYGDWQVVPIPTAPTRVRQRGYDQTMLIARELAARRNLPYKPVLTRVHDNRQVGSDRTTRLHQATDMFAAPSPTVRGAQILLIDDVCTTGATLQAAAQALRQAGAASVDAAVVAWQPLR